MARGALDFELPEAKVVLDEDDPKRVRDVVQSRANQEVKGALSDGGGTSCSPPTRAVARQFRERGLDTMWRVHDVPSDERLETLAQLAEANTGCASIPRRGKSPKKDARFSRQARLARGRSQIKRALNFLVLRTLKQAVYDVVNVGHFGLAAPDYLHFTSPIRRYPDLIVHRLLKHALKADGLPAGGTPPKPPTREELTRMAVESSTHERRAMQAEREVIDLYRAFLMREHVGEEYEGIIGGVAQFGLFVQIESPFVEGLVKVDTIGDDQYHYDERTMRLVGARSGRSFALGDPVRVAIANVSVQQHKIDLELLEHSPSVAAAPQRNFKRRTKEESRAPSRGHKDKDRLQRKHRRR